MAVTIASAQGEAQNQAIGNTAATTPENPVKYATQEFLVVETSTGLPRNEYYSRDGGLHLSAIGRFGLKNDGSILIIGWAETKDESAALRKQYPNTKFLSPQEKGGPDFLKEYNLLLKLNKISFRK